MRELQKNKAQPAHLDLAKQQLCTDIVEVMTRLKRDDFELARDLRSDTSTTHAGFRERFDAITGGDPLGDELMKAADILKDARELAQNLAFYESCYKSFGEHHSKLQKATSLAEQFEAFAVLWSLLFSQGDYVRTRLGREYELDASHDAMKEQLHQLLHARFAELTQSIPSEKGVRDIYKLISEWAVHLPELTWPENWKELVARHVYAPELHLYPSEDERRYRRDEALPALIIRAGTAIAHGDAAEAAIVFAYCNAEPHYRRAVGEQLFADLVLTLSRRHPRVSLPSPQHS